MLYQSTCVGFGYGPVAGAVSWNAKESRDNPLSPDDHPASVTSSGPRNIDLVPIGYGFRPRLRGRLTLRGLTLRRNPWTFGDRVSHPVGRYSCQHSHFRYLHRPSRVRLHRRTERSATGQSTIVSGQSSDQAAEQALQHAGDFPIRLLPFPRPASIDKAEIAGIGAPELHFLGRAECHAHEAPELGIGANLPARSFRQQ